MDLTKVLEKQIYGFVAEYLELYKRPEYMNSHILTLWDGLNIVYKENLWV